MAALSRMANRDHPIRIVQGDTVILACSLIPGNENAVYRVINGLTRWGANVVHKGNAMVHVSGHACAGELLFFYNIVQPQQRDARARRVAPPAGQRRARRADRGARPTRWSSPRTESSSTSSTAVAADHRQGAGGLRLRRRHRRSATSPSPRSRTGASSATRASSRCSSWSTPSRARSSPARRDPRPRLRARTTRSSTPSRPQSRRRWRPPPRTASATPTSSSSSSAARSGEWVSDTYRRRPMIVPVVVEA